MSRSIFSRTAIAATLLASTASAAFSASSKQNVAMYWGQGDSQIPLSEVCADPSIDVVNIGFVIGFPKKVGDYPKTNFANACWGDFYDHPTDNTQDNNLLLNCPSIEPGVKLCQQNGKKVLLSLGGGASNDYYLPSREVATYFAEFLVGAFGPQTKAWTDANKPRPWGSAAVDGFDLDLEADESKLPNAGFLSANYAFFVHELKRLQSSLLISAAPQCIEPDVRLSDAIRNAPFDMIFVQFYNTPQCSARLGYQQRNQATTGFTFKDWSDFLSTESFNKQAKLYLGLPAGPDGVDSWKDHYLKPEEADALIKKWQGTSNFGGVMLWEATVSVKNKNYCQSYGYWMKASLEGKFANYNKGCSLTSSSALPSSTKASSTITPSPSATVTPSASSSKVTSSSATPSKSASSSGNVSSSAQPSSSVHSSSAQPSSSVHSSSAQPSSSAHPSSSVQSSSVHSSSAQPSSSVHSSSAQPSSSAHSSSSTSAHESTSKSSYPSSSASPSASQSSSHDVSSTYAPYPSKYEHSSSDLSYSTKSTVGYPLQNSTSTPCTTLSKASSTPAGHGSSSTSVGHADYPVSSSTKGYANEYPPSVTTKPVKDAEVKPSSTTKVITTTYVDSCETGVTTKTETITQTICNKCKDDSVTSVYVCDKCGPTVVTYTITKPNVPATNVPSVPTGPAEPHAPTYGGDKPKDSEKPAPPAKPSTPPTYGGEHQAPPAKPSSPPTYGNEVPKKQEYPVGSTTVSVVYVAKTPVPVAPASTIKYTPIPYPSAPAKNGTSGYPVKPTGTGSVPSKPTSYVPPQFTGAATQVGAGMTGMLVVVAGLLVL